MDRIIKSISEIENKSVKIMDDANAKKTDIFSQIQAETKSFDSCLEAETNEKTKQLRARLERDMNEKLEHQSREAEHALNTLKEHYEQCRTDYVNRMFDEMTGV